MRHHHHYGSFNVHIYYTGHGHEHYGHDHYGHGYVGGDPGLVWPLLLIIAIVALVAATDRRKRK